MKKRALVLMLSLSVSAFAGGRISNSPLAQAIDHNCVQEAGNANCHGEEVGQGLWHCLMNHRIGHTHRHQNPITFADPCRTAMNNQCNDVHSKASAGKPPKNPNDMDCTVN